MGVTAYEDLAALDLDLMRSGEGERAREAFERLWANTRRGAMAHLRRSGVFGEEAEEIEIEVSGQLWKRRTSIRATGLAEWYALVRTALSRHLAKRRARAEHQSLENVPLAEAPYLQAIMEAAEERTAIYSAADTIWLGELPNDVDPLASTAAAQFVFVEGLSTDEVAAMLRVDVTEVDRWLSIPAVVARAIFNALCWESDTLAAHLLRAEPPLSERELDRIASGEFNASELSEWSDVEARVLCLHVRNALLDEEIVRLLEGRIDREELRGILDRVVGAYPFRQMAREMKGSGIQAILGNADLWRRVSFEYHVRHELPYKQIQERAAPPAEEGGFSLSSTTLTSWIGQGRLWARLAAFLREAAQ